MTTPGSPEHDEHVVVPIRRPDPAAEHMAHGALGRAERMLAAMTPEERIEILTEKLDQRTLMARHAADEEIIREQITIDFEAYVDSGRIITDHSLLTSALQDAYREWNAVGGQYSGASTQAEHIGIRVMACSASQESWRQKPWPAMPKPSFQ